MEKNTTAVPLLQFAVMAAALRLVAAADAAGAAAEGDRTTAALRHYARSGPTGVSYSLGTALSVQPSFEEALVTALGWLTLLPSPAILPSAFHLEDAPELVAWLAAPILLQSDDPAAEAYVHWVGDLYCPRAIIFAD